MFGHMRAEPILRVKPACPAGEAVITLTKATDETQAVRWIEFPAAVLVFVIVTGDRRSGAFYVLNRKTGTWFWVDFEDDQYGGYSVSNFDLLMHEYDFLSLVERPALLRAGAGLVVGTRQTGGNGNRALLVRGLQRPFDRNSTSTYLPPSPIAAGGSRKGGSPWSDE